MYVHLDMLFFSSLGLKIFYSRLDNKELKWQPQVFTIASQGLPWLMAS